MTWLIFSRRQQFNDHDARTSKRPRKQALLHCYLHLLMGRKYIQTTIDYVESDPERIKAIADSVF